MMIEWLKRFWLRLIGCKCISHYIDYGEHVEACPKCKQINWKESEMSGKSKREKRKAAKTKQRLHEELNQKAKKVAEPEELGNNAEPLPLTADTVNEDEQKDGEKPSEPSENRGIKGGIPMETIEDNVKRMEAEKPFDPMSVVNKVLKKKEVGDG